MSGLIQWLQQQGQQQQHPSNLQSPEQARLAQIAQSGQLQTIANRVQGAGFQDPGAFRQAVHNLWQRYGGQQQQPQSPGGTARFAGLTPMPSGGMAPQQPPGLQGGGLPPLSAPPPGGGQGNFNPSSIRVDFHPPQEQ